MGRDRHPDAGADLLIRPADGDGDLERYYAADSAAFGVPFDATHIAAKRPVIDPSRFYLAESAGRVVGAAGSFAFDLTLPGGATVPVAGVSDVGVLPTDRRRGVLRALLARVHADSAARGEVAAVLTASEATIYGRFGYGLASRVRFATVDLARAAYRPDAPVADGALRLVDRDDAAPVLAEVYRRAAGDRAGGLSRRPEWWSAVLGDVDLYIGGHPAHRVVVHHDADGAPDAYGIYRTEERWTEAGPRGTIHAWEVVGVTPAAELAVWRFLFDHDLVVTAEGVLPPDHVLPLVLDDPRCLAGGDRDNLWLRPVDVPALLEARSYRGDGTLRLGLGAVDSLPGGRFRLDVRDGRAAVGSEGVGDAAVGGADLVAPLTELAPVLLGDRRWCDLVAAGRVQERVPGAAALADDLFRVDRGPWCGTRF